MNFKKYLPSGTQAVQVLIIVIVLGSLGVIAKTQGWLERFTGRF